MGRIRISRIIFLSVVLVAAALCVQPVLATDGTIAIAYRGSGGNYIGDTIVFDGANTVSNVTGLRITGPGLPSGGVPVYDLGGAEGTGNPVAVNADGSWRFVWYTSLIQNLDKMQTARYYITAFDISNPSKTATTSIMMKKPDFYVVASPNPLETGDYVQLIGTAEKGTVDVRIDILDTQGKNLHTYDTAASGSGYFNYGFHIDMPPGTYYVKITSSSIRTPYQTTLTVIPPGASVTPAPAGSSEPPVSVSATPATAGSEGQGDIPAGAPAASEQPTVKSSPAVPASLIEAIAGLGIAVIVILCLVLIRKKNP
jgi:hypothetical protein